MVARRSREERPRGTFGTGGATPLRVATGRQHLRVRLLGGGGLLEIRTPTKKYEFHPPERPSDKALVSRIVDFGVEQNFSYESVPWTVDGEVVGTIVKPTKMYVMGGPYDSFKVWYTDEFTVVTFQDGVVQREACGGGRVQVTSGADFCIFDSADATEPAMVFVGTEMVSAGEANSKTMCIRAWRDGLVALDEDGDAPYPSPPPQIRNNTDGGSDTESEDSDTGDADEVREDMEDAEAVRDDMQGESPHVLLSVVADTPKVRRPRQPKRLLPPDFAGSDKERCGNVGCIVWCNPKHPHRHAGNCEYEETSKTRSGRLGANGLEDSLTTSDPDEAAGHFRGSHYSSCRTKMTARMSTGGKAPPKF